MARVAVVGVGAIGGVVAALLATVGRHEVTLCTRRPLEVLTVKTPEGVVTVKAKNIVDPALAEAVDWVIVTTKTYDAPGVAAWLHTLCGSGTRVAVIQNGVEHRERFQAIVDAEKIVAVVIDCATEREGHDRILQRGKARMQVEAGQSGVAFAELFVGSNADITITDDFPTAAWRKLCINAAGAISALVGKPAGVMHDPELGKLAVEIVAECVAVGRAEGARLEDGIGEQVLEMYRAQAPESVNSMLADRIAGRPMEIDARNGAIVRKGEKHGIKTPLNEMVVALLRAL